MSKIVHRSQNWCKSTTMQLPEELAKSVKCLAKASTAYGMEISAEKIKLMTNNTSGIKTEIKVNGQKLETVTSFKYLGSVITDEGSNTDKVETSLD